MNTQDTMNIAFDVRFDKESGFAFFPSDSFESSVYAASLASAKSKLRPLVTQEIQDALTEHRNYQRKVFGCNSGDILIVNYRYGNWGYDIAGPNRSGCCTNSGFKTFDDACIKAKEHADQSYEGIAWQC